MQRYRPFLIIGLVLAVAVIGTLLLIRRSKSDQFTGGPPASPALSATPAASEEPTKLPSDIVVNLEEYGDYQCPPCGQLHPALKKIKQDLGPNLNFVFHNFPLEQIHKNALAAAQAAEAARMQSRFWEMHDLLYESQEFWIEEANPKPVFIKFARDLGMDVDRFVRDMGSDQVRMRIQADKDAGVRVGVTGTPTIFVDGRQLKVEATTPEGIRQAVQFMIKQKTTESP